MRLVAKLTLLMMLGILAVLTLDGYLTISRELARFDTDMRSDAQLYGHALSRTTAEVWETQGEQRALQAIAEANAIDDHLSIRLVWLSGATRPDQLPAIPQSRIAEVGDQATSLVAHDDGPGHLYTYVPLRVYTGRRPPPRIAVEIAESLQAEHNFRRETIRRIVLVVSATVLVCTFVALILGVWVVGRPIHRLVDRARAIGAGDLEGTLSMHRTDEFGLLAAEIDAMSRSLFQAHERVAEETAERLRIVEQLRHADRLATVGTLAAGIAHEMGSPLNIVGERAAMIERQQVTGDAVLTNAKTIRKQSARMTAIIRQLLDFARRRTTEAAPCDLSRLTRDIAELLESYASERDVQVVPPPEDEKVVAAVDREQIQQAFTNLIINAIQASKPGGRVEVTIDHVTAARPDDPQSVEKPWVRITVEDHGDGMTEENAVRVFEPFFTTKDVGEGTGLGLAVTHGIVSDHQGWIAVDTAPGEGARFRVHLPEESES